MAEQQLTTFARVADGTVRELHRGTAVFPLPADAAAAWHAVPADQADAIAEGWTWDGENFAAPDGASLADAKGRQKARVKARAGAIIMVAYPDWKQRNLIARGADLLSFRVADGWTDDEAAEAAALQAVWDWIKSVRAASDTHEAAIDALESVAAVDAYDLMAGWPE